MRSMYASGSSPDAAASCRTSSFARLAAPLGRPAPGRFPPCPFIVLSRATENRAPYNFTIRFICTTMRYSSEARGVRFRYRGCLPFHGARAQYASSRLLSRLSVACSSSVSAAACSTPSAAVDEVRS